MSRAEEVSVLLARRGPMDEGALAEALPGSVREVVDALKELKDEGLAKKSEAGNWFVEGHEPDDEPPASPESAAGASPAPPQTGNAAIHLHDVLSALTGDGGLRVRAEVVLVPAADGTMHLERLIKVLGVVE